MLRRLLLTLPAAATLLAATAAVGSPAFAAQGTPMQAHGRGAGAGLTADDGSNIYIYANQATNHAPGGAPTSSSQLWIERYGAQSCDDGGAYPDGTNTCTSSYLRIDVYPLADGALNIGPALTSATLPKISAPYQQHDCTTGPGYAETCTDINGVTDVTASFTATGPINNSIYHEQYSFGGCRSTLLSSSRGRPANAAFSFLGSSYTATGTISEDVGLQRNC